MLSGCRRAHAQHSAMTIGKRKGCPQIKSGVMLSRKVDSKAGGPQAWGLGLQGFGARVQGLGARAKARADQSF